MTAESKIKREARVRLSNQNWGKAVAITIVLYCVPIVQILCNSLLIFLLQFDETMPPDQIPRPYFYLLFASVILFSLISFPLKLGSVRWNLHASQGFSPPVNELFYYFSGGRLYFRALSCGFQLAGRLLPCLLICLAPGTALACYCSLNSNLADSPMSTVPMWAVWGNLLSVALLCAGIAVFVAFSLRYFAVETAVASLEHQSVHQCIACSVRKMKGKKGSAFVLIFSFVGWWLLCFFVLPVLYVSPYYRMSVVTCSKWILIDEIRQEYEQTRAETPPIDSDWAWQS